MSMSLTEDEAKTKVCCGPPWPAAIALVANQGLSIKTSPDTGKCIGSACMAWRWERTPLEAEIAAQNAPQTHAKSPFRAYGYCGLAGKP